MKGSFRMEGAAEYSRFLEGMAKGLDRDVSSLLRQEARALCVEFGAATMPGKLEESGAQGLRAQVEREVKRVFPTRSNPRVVYALLERRSLQLAKGFWRVVKENPGGWLRDPQALRYMRAGGIKVDALDPSVHKRARTGRNGMVAKNFQPEGIVSEPQQRAYVRRKVALVGFAKAGWYAAAKALGGRVRRNLRDESGGNRKTEEKFPAYVRKIARKFPGIGGAVVGPKAVTVFSNVRHAREAMPEHLEAKAVGLAEAKLRQGLLESVRKRKSRRFSAAA